MAIDHPDDPSARYLKQAVVLAPERLSICRGTVVLDETGAAWVEPPSWFESVTTDLSYHLTPIGAPMPGLYVAEELAGGRFRVAGGAAGMRVSWQLIGARDDPWARDHPFAAETPKPEDEFGTYLYPQGWGADETLSLEHLGAEPAEISAPPQP